MIGRIETLLVKRSEERYHDFAVETMIKAFVPADFAPQQAAPAAVAAAPATIDLGSATFLFTGKLATMNRKEAEDHAAKLTTDKRSTHFIQPVKEPIEEKKEEKKEKEK